MLSIKQLLLVLSVVSILAFVTGQPTVAPLAGHPGLFVMTTWITEGVPFPVPFINNLLIIDNSTTPANVVMFDTNNFGMYPLVRAALDTVTTANVSILINTHWHPDHVGINADFHEHGTSRIIAAKGVKAAMSVNHTMNDMPPELQFVPASPPAAYPTEEVRFIKLLCPHANGEHILLFVAPSNAHSGNDMIAQLLHANVVVAGDVFLPHQFPFIDRSSGGSIHGLIAAARLLLSFTNSQTVVIPSHGTISGRAEVLEFVNMLESVERNVTAQIEAGATLEQVLACPLLGELLAQGWGYGFFTGEFFFTVVYRDLTGAPL